MQALEKRERRALLLAALKAALRVYLDFFLKTKKSNQEEATVIHADLNGILDLCHCGAVAGFETDEDTATAKYRVRCSECCEQTEWSGWLCDVAAAWNVARREEKTVKA